MRTINKITKKLAVVGTGFVGMSFAYALLCEGLCDELVLIDVNKEKANGEAMDLNHGLPFAKTNMKIYSGGYSDCGDADIVVICAGVNQKPGEDRISLLTRNAEVFRSIVSPVLNSGFEGIFVIATNPVDIMTRITKELSGFDYRRVIGTGTTLDTARIRYLLGDYFSVDPKNVHAYVMGEHGESETVPWSQAQIGTKSIIRIIDESGGKFKMSQLDKIASDVTGAAEKIIRAKGATYYGIGMSLVRIVKAIFGDEKSVLTVSSLLHGEYGVKGVYAGVPSVLGRNGVEDILKLSITESEKDDFRRSCKILSNVYDRLSFYGMTV